MSNKPSLKKNIFLNVFYEIICVIAPFITAPYVSRVLQSSGVGIYSYTQSLVTYFTMFAALGTGTYGLREIAMCRDDKEQYSRTFWGIEIISVCTSVLSLIVWFFIAYLYASYRIYLLILSLNILSTLFDISWFYRGLEKFQYTILINSLAKILNIVLIFLFVKTPSDTWIYVLITALSTLLGNVSMWVFLPFYLKRTKVEKASIRHHLKETFVYFIPTIATTIYTVLDKTLIGMLIPGTVTTVDSNGNEVVQKLSDIENGYYEQATKIINIVKTMAFIGINGVMASRSSYLYGKKDEEGVKKLLKTTYSITLLLSIGASFGIAAIASNFVPIFFGEGYDKTVYILYVLCFLSTIICISNVLGAVYYTPSGRRRDSTKYLIIGSLINLVLSIPLILVLKSIGAALASVIAESAISVLYIVHSNKMYSFRELFQDTWKKILSGILMFAAVFGLGAGLNGEMNAYILLAIQILLGIAVYLIMLLVLKDTSVRETFRFFVGKSKRRKHGEEA